MLSLEQLQKRIKTTQELLSVVKTMKVLAAVSIRQYENAAASLEKYNSVVDMGWQILFRQQVAFPGGGSRKDVVILVLGSDQGMCGQFNDVVLERALAQRDELARQDIRTFFWTAGERIRAGIADMDQVATHYSLPGSIPAINSLVQLIVRDFEACQREKGIDALQVIHNKLVQGATYQTEWLDLLPLDRNWLARYTNRSWPGPCLPMLGIGREELFHHLFHQYLFASLYRALAQSMASENAARLASMQAAEKNILELADELQAKFRETRQNAITVELFDIIAGFEALAGSKNP